MNNKHKTFKPFEKVLVQNLQGIWMIDFYSNWNEKWQGHQTFKVNGDYAQTDDGILPYEGNKHLIGTTDEPHIPISEKETQDAYWANCTEEEKANLRGSYNEFLKDDSRGRSILEKFCGKHNLQEEAETNPYFERKISNMEDLFGKENLQPNSKIRIWKDVEKKHPEHFSRSNAPDSMFIPSQEVRDKLLKKVMAIYKIAILIELGYGGMVSDEEWKDDNCKKYAITYYPQSQEKFIPTSCYIGEHKFIAFHTYEQREEFMSYPDNMKLIEQYYMI